MECVKTLFHGSLVWQVNLNPSEDWINQKVLRYDCESFTKTEAIKNAESYL